MRWKSLNDIKSTCQSAFSDVMVLWWLENWKMSVGDRQTKAYPVETRKKQTPEPRSVEPVFCCIAGPRRPTGALGCCLLANVAQLIPSHHSPHTLTLLLHLPSWNWIAGASRPSTARIRRAGRNAENRMVTSRSSSHSILRSTISLLEFFPTHF